MKKVWLILLLTPLLLFGQDDYSYQNQDEYGMGLSIAMSGFGIGGYYRFAMPNDFFVGASLDFYLMRDEKQVTYYDPYYGIPIERNKVNRLYVIPFTVELKRRLFAESIEDSFRPYLIGAAGATFGMNFPKIAGLDDEYRTTFNLEIGFGVDFTRDNDFYVSVRPQYRIIYFPEEIASKKNHSSFEIRIELGKRR
ncbi:MAG: hypothetical protein WAN36_02160 [Calditrichia bacterium]